MQKRTCIVVLALLGVAVLGGTATAYTSPSLTSLYTQVAYLGFQVQNLLNSDATQNQQIQSLQMQLNAEVLARTSADAALQAQVTTNTSNIALNASAISSHVANTTTAHSYDARYVRTSDTMERQISGALNPDGSIYSGTGFSSVRNSLGNYTITFSTPFTGNTRAVIDVFDGRHMDTQALSNGAMTIQIRDAAGNAVDESWDFVVFGR